MEFTTLIDAGVLAKHLDDPRFVIFDCRHDLAKPDWGIEVYLASHIPGARFAHLDKNLSGPKTGKNGRHPLPDPQSFARWLSEMGAGNDSQIIGYDSTGGTYGARLWWMVRWLGQQRVAVLNGGWDAWVKSGFPVTQDKHSPRATTFHMRLHEEARVDANFILRNLESQKYRVLDARANDRFHGQNETIDPTGGHIPGATNRFFKDNLDAQSRFKPSATLKAEFEALLHGRAPSQVIHQCGSGVTACHNALAMEIAGLPGSKVYPGSWSEWIADPARPIATT
ncbi:MAG: sulfurtransferase [Betaproteobacteria bacterium]|nr:sulfurtransferase [Betaproteobacteria bacterium]